MAVQGYGKCAKYFIFAAAIVEIILAITALGFGIYYLVLAGSIEEKSIMYTFPKDTTNNNQMINFSEDRPTINQDNQMTTKTFSIDASLTIKTILETFGIIIVIVAIISIINGILGAIGSIKENLGCLIAHLVLLTLSFVLFIYNFAVGYATVYYACSFVYNAIRFVHVCILIHWMKKPSYHPA